MSTRLPTTLALRREYTTGLVDGLLMAFDHIEGKPSAAGDVYTGPVPGELREYIERARRQAAGNDPRGAA